MTLVSAVVKQKGDINQAIALSKAGLEVLQHVLTTQRGDYNEFRALQFHSSLLLHDPTRKSEGEAVLAEAKELVQKLPYWSSRAVHLHIPIWQVV